MTISSSPALSPREREVLDLAAQGRTRRQIAERLGISEQTVKNHATRIYAALGAANMPHAVYLAYVEGRGLPA